MSSPTDETGLDLQARIDSSLEMIRDFNMSDDSCCVGCLLDDITKTLEGTET